MKKLNLLFLIFLFIGIIAVNGQPWTQIGGDIDGEAATDHSGHSVSLSSDGSIVAIGAIGNNSEVGHVRVYQNNSGTWNQIGNDIDGEFPGDKFGWSVKLSSDGLTLAVGVPYYHGINSDQ